MTIDDLIYLVGRQEVEKALLRRQVEELTRQVEELRTQVRMQSLRPDDSEATAP